MSDTEPTNTELQDLHRSVVALIKGVDPQVVMAVLAMTAAEMIVAHVPPAQRPGQLRKFDDGVRSFTRTLGDELIKALAARPAP
jgi:hypothetical protein